MYFIKYRDFFVQLVMDNGLSAFLLSNFSCVCERGNSSELEQKKRVRGVLVAYSHNYQILSTIAREVIGGVAR